MDCKVRQGNITPIEEIPAGLKVKIYRNLSSFYRTRKMVVYSVADAKTGKVIYHVEQIRLKDVTFRINEAGRERVLRDKQKNVHAFIHGTTADVPAGVRQALEVTYNPYTHKTFIFKKFNAAIMRADNVLCGQLGVRMWNQALEVN